MSFVSGLVSLVTVNFNGRHLLERLLEALSRQSYRQTEIIVVDNASTDGSAEFLRRRFPGVQLIQAPRNLGFAGGNNLGIRESRGEFIGLINNDAVPEPDWLAELLAEARAHPAAAAVASKILLYKPFLPVLVECETSNPARRGISPDDCRSGARFDIASGFAKSGYLKPIFKQGFSDPEPAGDRMVRWTAGQALAWLPVANREEAAVLQLSLGGDGAQVPRQVRIQVGAARAEARLESDDFVTVRLEVPAEVVAEHGFDVVNNAGSVINGWGESADRGLFEADRGQFEDSEEVSAVCGAAVLLRREALTRTGLFDEDFFMYYEDTDLSWRLRSRGYSLRYRPTAVVRHMHAASSVEWSPAFSFRVARNKILMIAKNGSPRQLLRAYRRELGWCLQLLWRWLRRPRWGLPQPLIVRLKVQASLMHQLPRAWLKRWGLLAPHSLVAG